jgi:hypothetical protein
MSISARCFFGEPPPAPDRKSEVRSCNRARGSSTPEAGSVVAIAHAGLGKTGPDLQSRLARHGTDLTRLPGGSCLSGVGRKGRSPMRAKIRPDGPRGYSMSASGRRPAMSRRVCCVPRSLRPPAQYERCWRTRTERPHIGQRLRAARQLAKQPQPAQRTRASGDCFTASSRDTLAVSFSAISAMAKEGRGSARQPCARLSLPRALSSLTTSSARRSVEDDDAARNSPTPWDLRRAQETHGLVWRVPVVVDDTRRLRSPFHQAEVITT